MKKSFAVLFITALAVITMNHTQAWGAEIHRQDCSVSFFTSNMSPHRSQLHKELIETLNNKGYSVFVHDLSWLEFLGRRKQALEFFSQPDALYVAEESGNIFSGSDCAIYSRNQVECRYSAHLKTTQRKSLGSVSFAVSSQKKFYNDPAAAFYKNVREQFKAIPNCVTVE